jgi:hypothetical protein
MAEMIRIYRFVASTGTARGIECLTCICKLPGFAAGGSGRRGTRWSRVVSRSGLAMPPHHFRLPSIAVGLAVGRLSLAHPAVQHTSGEQSNVSWNQSRYPNSALTPNAVSHNLAETSHAIKVDDLGGE